MKRSLILFAVLATTLTGVAWLAAPARAVDESQSITEAHIERIRTNCVDAQSTLFQLHTSDAGLRVNRGQLYESIATKLMAPLNSRIVLNRLDSVTLVSIADQYNKQLQQFRAQYKDYDEAMAAALKLNCVNQPVAFYDKVVETRAKRQLAHESAMTLHKTIQQYGEAFEVFAESIPEEEAS